MVYKPIAGERPLWDFPDGTLAGREVAAYAVSEALGWDIVPPTILRRRTARAGHGPAVVRRGRRPGAGRHRRPRRRCPHGFRHVFDGLDAHDQPVSLVHEDSPALRRMAVFDVGGQQRRPQGRPRAADARRPPLRRRPRADLPRGARSSAPCCGAGWASRSPSAEIAGLARLAEALDGELREAAAQPGQRRGDGHGFPALRSAAGPRAVPLAAGLVATRSSRGRPSEPAEARRIGFAPCVPGPSPEVPGLPVDRTRRPRARHRDGRARRDPSRGPARLYVCGITPYDATHMGHAATYVAFDLLNRAWRSAGSRGGVRPERHRRRRPAARAGAEGARRLGRAGRARDRALPRGHGGAARPRAGPLHRRGRVDPAGDRAHRAARRGRRGLQASTTTSTSRSPPTRRSARSLGPRPRDDAADLPRARRRPRPRRQEGPARLPAVARRASGRAVVGQPVRARAARLAHRVHRDRPGAPRRRLRRPGRRQRPGLPAPRDVRRPRAGRRPGERVRAGLRARRDGRLRRREDVEVARATWSSSPRCATARSTRWRSGWCCCATTTAATGSGPTPSSGTPSTRSPTGAAPSPSAPAPRRPRWSTEVLAALADDLDAPRAVAAVQAWVDATLGTHRHSPTPPTATRADDRTPLLDAALGARVLSDARLSPRRSPLEVALELPRDRLAGRLGEVRGVAGLLQRADVVGDVLVLLGELVDAALPGPGVLGQVAERDAALEQVLELAEQGERRPWGTAAGRRSGGRRPSRRPPGCRAGCRRPGRRRRCRSGLRRSTARA